MSSPFGKKLCPYSSDRALDVNPITLRRPIRLGIVAEVLWLELRAGELDVPHKTGKQGGKGTVLLSIWLGGVALA